jgi:hypothetical protein
VRGERRKIPTIEASECVTKKGKQLAITVAVAGQKVSVSSRHRDTHHNDNYDEIAKIK